MNEFVVTPKLVVEGADRAIEFYVAVLGARPVARFTSGESVVFAQLEVGGSTFQLKDADDVDPAPPAGGGGMIMDLTCADPDVVFERAVAHGAHEVFAVADQLYGARAGRFRDPFGHQWIVSTPIAGTDEQVQSSLDG